MTSSTVYLIDDNTDFLDSTRFWLEGLDFQVEVWNDPGQAVAALGKHPLRDTQTACVLMDIRMPTLSGLDVYDLLTEAGCQLPVIFMSGHADVPLAVEAMKKGAISLLEKPFDEATLLAALESAFAVAPRQNRPVTAATTGTGATDPSSPEIEMSGELAQGRQRFIEREAKLSPREREVLAQVIEGIYNKNIADNLNISIKTVELYRSRGMAKMQVRSVAALTRMMVSEQA